MAQRRWQVHPDQLMETPNGPIGVISKQALAEAVYDGTVMLHRGGGVLEVVVVRHPTDLEGEMATIGAIVQWKDRTNAKPQPEVAAPTPPPLRAVEEPEAADLEQAPTDLERATAELAGLPVPGEAPVEDVDEADVPAHLRAG